MSPSEPPGASISDQPAAEGNLLTASCPLPITDYKEIVLAHGSGGKLSHQLISKNHPAAVRERPACADA
jgi:hypothetical protein